MVYTEGTSECGWGPHPCVTTWTYRALGGGGGGGVGGFGQPPFLGADFVHFLYKVLGRSKRSVQNEPF